MNRVPTELERGAMSAPGLAVMQALVDAELTAVAGPKGKHDPGAARCATVLPAAW